MAVATILVSVGVGLTVGAISGALTTAITLGVAGTAITTAAVVSGALTAAVYGGIAGLLGGIALALAPKPDLSGFGLSGGSVQTLRVNPGAAAYAFGMCRIKPQICFVETRGNTLYIAQALSEHSLDTILGVRADGRDVEYTVAHSTTSAGGRVATLTGTGKWGGVFWAQIYLDAQTDAQRAANGSALRRASSVWGPEHVLPCTWAFIRCTYVKKQSSPLYAHVPDLTWDVKGIRVTWPGQTTPTWTRNAAAIRYWYETQVIGRTVSSVTYTAAHNRCGTVLNPGLLPGGLDGIRWGIDGVAFGEYTDIARHMDSAWQGNMIWRADEWHLQAGARRAAVKTLTPDDVTAVHSSAYSPPRQKRLNRVTTGVESSIVDGFAPVDMPPLVDMSLRNMDANAVTLPLARLRLVGDTKQTGRIMRTQLYRTRGAGEHRISVLPGTGFDNWGLRDHDVVNLQLPGYGANGDRYVVNDVKIEPDASVSMTLQAELPTTYDDIAYSAYPAARQLPV